jgi:parallel beta-helix repeat protein
VEVVKISLVAYNGRKTGLGSKRETTNSSPGSSFVLRVMPNQPNSVSGSAVIENLIIDGNNAAGAPVAGITGILLEDVCNCLVRNVTIRNCEVGIRVKVTSGNRAFGNRFEHIRMINVKTGILFEGAENAKDFSYTTIDNVRTSLPETVTSGAVGIHVSFNARLYNALVRATTWLSGSMGTGLRVDGEIKYSLVNFEVENNGTGMQISSGATVSGNQSFLLTTMGVTNSLSNNSAYGNDVTVVTL